MKQFVFILLVVLLQQGLANNVSNDYYNHTFLGEIDLGDYFGPVNNQFSVDRSSEKIQLLDDQFSDHYLNNNLENEIFRLSSFWIDESYPDISCPNHYLADNYNYIHYLYRLIGISYLFEAMKEYQIESYRLGVSSKSCSLKWEDTFGKCKPKSLEMKKFLSRIKDRHLMGYEKERLIKQNKKQIEQWILSFNEQLHSGEYLGIVERRIGNKYSAGSSINIYQLEKSFEQICEDDRKIINRFCSEVDNYYGLSDIEIFTYLLQRSNAISVINSGGHGRACLKRFTKINSSKEQKISYFQELAEDIYSKIKKSDLRYKQGNIFIAGALKEFDDKGLDDFIFAAKKETVKPKPRPVVVKPKPVVVKPKPVVVRPKPVVVKPKPMPKPVVKPAKIVTQFEVARKKLFASEKLTVSVDMAKFKSDFKFTQAMIKALKEPLMDFQTRQGLEDMKKWDKLGTKNEPVRLIFLKFLIDNKLHKGLFNLTAVLGKQFYVSNDIDRVKVPVYTELKNDEDTNYQWTLILHKEKPTVKVTEKKKSKKKNSNK